MICNRKKVLYVILIALKYLNLRSSRLYSICIFLDRITKDCCICTELNSFQV